MENSRQGETSDLSQKVCILRCLYEMYKSRWLESRNISREMERDERARYYIDRYNSDGFAPTITTFDDYVAEHGISDTKESYVSIKEFKNNEFMDNEYIKDICGETEALYDIYIKLIHGEL